jgi:hypothetical protein
LRSRYRRAPTHRRQAPAANGEASAPSGAVPAFRADALARPLARELAVAHQALPLAADERDVGKDIHVLVAAVALVALGRQGMHGAAFLAQSFDGII